MEGNYSVDNKQMLTSCFNFCSTLYAVNLMEAKPEPGLYKLSVNAVPVKPDPRWVGNIGVVLSLKVMCAAVVESFEIGTGDADQSTQPKFEK